MIFDINYNKTDNRLQISCKETIEVIVYLYQWETTKNELKLLHKYQSTKFNNSSYLYEAEQNLYDLNGIKIEIEEKGKKIEERYIRFRNRYGEIIKKQALLIPSKIGIGDAIITSTVIRKMSQIYNQKITIFSLMPEIFINSPYIEKSLDIRDIQTHLNDKNYNTSIIWDVNKLNYASVDLRQICAWNLGFELKDDELDIEFFPDKFKEIPNLPEKFICISPVKTYTDRTWSVENWQKFISLIEKHIPVVAIGKSVEIDDACLKDFHSIQINNGLNLLGQECQNTLSQAWHIINKCETFVSINTGLYILALTTDSHITELSSAWNMKRLRIRKGIQDYKAICVEGKCKIHCTSDLKVSVDEYSDHIRSVFVHHNTPVTEFDHLYNNDKWWYKKQCYLGKSTYECHPTPEQVYEEVLKIIK